VANLPSGKKMGVVWSYCCGEEGSDEYGDASERTRLISDHSPQQTFIPDLIQEDGRIPPFSTSLPKVNDELNDLQNIQHEIAGNVIDISAIDHLPVIEQNDFLEKATIYEKRISQVGARLAAKHARHSGMAEAPDGDIIKTLSEDPIVQEDLELITEIAMRSEAETDQFKIKHEDDLVTVFGER